MSFTQIQKLYPTKYYILEYSAASAPKYFIKY